MRKTTTIFLLLAAAGLAGCPTSSAHDSGPLPGTDMGPTNQPDTGVDSGPATGMDSGVPVTDVPIASVVDASQSNHPTASAVIHVTGDLVALTPRLSTQNSAGTLCSSSIWVGTAAGGNFSGIQVFESYPPATGMMCDNTDPPVMPASIAIGTPVTNLIGSFTNFCMGTCPPNTAQEIVVTHGTFTVGGTAGADPTSTTVTIADITGTGITYGPRTLQLQGAVVTIANTVVAMDGSMTGVPSTGTTGNHGLMTVAASGTTTPVMHIQMNDYPGVVCERGLVTANGQTIGSITGVLTYSFGNWTIQPRRLSDLPTLATSCASDAGASTADSGLDAGVDAH